MPKQIYINTLPAKRGYIPPKLVNVAPAKHFFMQAGSTPPIVPDNLIPNDFSLDFHLINQEIW